MASSVIGIIFKPTWFCTYSAIGVAIYDGTLVGFSITVVINPVIPHNSGTEAELMAECEKRIETQQPLIEGKGPFAVAKVV